MELGDGGSEVRDAPLLLLVSDTRPAPLAASEEGEREGAIGENGKGRETGPGRG